MYNKEREQEILSILKTANGFVSVAQLCEALFASESSVRRDLKALEKKGLVKRSYGGVSPVSNYSNIVNFNHRTRQNVEAKKIIAKKAAKLVKDGGVIFLDQSSTAFYLAAELVGRSSLTVVTNNIEIMMLLSNSAVRVISSGGFLSSENRNCLIGVDATKAFENIFADAVFFSIKAVDGEGNITDCTREEVVVRNAMLKNASQKVLLCDSSKFGTKAAFKQCGLDEIDYLISEDSCSEYFKETKGEFKVL